MSKLFSAIKCWTAKRKTGKPYKVCINAKKWVNKKSKSTILTNTSKSEQNLIKEGFSPKVVKKVLSKMKQYKRPSYVYSKTTGKMKQTFKNK